MRVSFRSQLRHRLVVAGVLMAIAGLLQFADANPAASQSLSLTAYAAQSDPSMDPSGRAWKVGPAVQVPLSGQLAVYPTGGGGIRTVGARALHYQDRLYVRLEWTDATVDDSTTRAQDFADAAAVEFPAKSAASVPSVCMGQADGGVSIWQWRADSQKGIQEPVGGAYVSAYSDGYPVNDPIYYTARAVGNPYASANSTQTLIARTFGSLTPAPRQDVQGSGERQGKQQWAVVFSRPFTPADDEQAVFAVGAQTDVAFAVWDGSQAERSGRKSVSSFVKLDLSEKAPPGSGVSNPFGVASVIVGAVALFGIAVHLTVRARARQRIQG